MSDTSEKRKQYKKDWVEKNKEKLKQQQKDWYDNNRDERKNYIAENKEKYKGYSKKYYEANKDVIQKRNNKYVRTKCNTDPLYKLKRTLRCSISNILKRKGYVKQSKTVDIIGCDFETMKTHVESQWESWMTWDNYGLFNGTPNYGWDIDHVIPIASGTNEAEVLTLNNYKNLKPLCSYMNRIVKRDNH